MARSPIDIAMDSVMRCTRCDAPMGHCDCWVKITLKCPGCGRTKQTTREPEDPKGAKVVELRCPKCWIDT